MDSYSLEPEAELFGGYLLKRPPNENVKKFYIKAVSNTFIEIKGSDKKVLDFLYRNRWSIGFIDSGLALLYPHSEIRKRIYIMFALLESSPEYVDLFLPKKRNFLYLFVLFFVGIRSILKSLIGILLLKIIR